MRHRIRVSLLVLVGALLLAGASSALGDESAWQVVTNWGSCSGFTVETVSGAVDHCIPVPDGVTPFTPSYAAAENGSVVFMAEDNTDPNSGDQGSIWLVKSDGSSVHLDSDTWDSEPSISYDGSKVVFAQFDPATGSSDIYSVNSDGSDLQLVVSGQGTQYLRLPSISPDGSTVAYWCGPADADDTTSQGCGPLTDGSYRNSGVMRVNIDGSDPRMIVIGPGEDNPVSVGGNDFSWSPDSQWLAMDGTLTVYLGDNEYSSISQLFEYRTDGSDLFNTLDPTRQITNFVYGADVVHSPAFPQFSPDGSELLYMDFVDGSGDQGNFSYLIGADGSDPHQVFLDPNTTCANGSCSPPSFGVFIPTATPAAPPVLVDETHEPVPSVANKTIQGATSTLNAAHLTVGTVQHVVSAVPAGLVVSQNPAAGAIAHRTTKAGPPVALVVSTGAPPPTVALTVTKSGTGSGTVTSTPIGVSCGSTCTHKFLKGPTVTLVATAAFGSRFAGWSGPCTGTGQCHVAMSQARTVNASFTRLTACIVPNVKGRTLASAKAALTAVACNVGTVSKAYSSTVKAGYVMSESPVAGTRHAVGAKVALVVSKGPAG